MVDFQPQNIVSYFGQEAVLNAIFFFIGKHDVYTLNCLLFSRMKDQSAKMTNLFVLPTMFFFKPCYPTYINDTSCYTQTSIYQAYYYISVYQ